MGTGSPEGGPGKDPVHLLASPFFLNTGMKPALYVHIPFCSAKCDYCDFFSLDRRSREDKEAFTRALVRQLSFFCDRLKIDEFPTVYIGGGTPSSIGLDRLERLLSIIANLIKKEGSESSSLFL